MRHDDDWDPRDADPFEAALTPPEHYQGMTALIAFLASEPGGRAMAWLRSMTTERCVQPAIMPDAAVWHLEGQRALVLGLAARVQQFVNGRH